MFAMVIGNEWDAHSVSEVIVTQIDWQELPAQAQ